MSGIMAVLRRPRVRRLLQSLLLLITFASIAWALAGQWSELQRAARDVTVQWRWVFAASAVVLATYAMLVQSWRMLLGGWGGHLPYGTAVRIWTIANLGRYIPGKVWSIGALGVMAAQEGVSGVAAAGAAVLGTLLNIGAGLAIAVITGAQGFDAVRPGLRVVAIAGSVLFVVGVALLPVMLPPLLDRFARWRGIALAERHLSHATIWTAAAINAASWVGYGAAFALFSRGVTPRISSDPVVFIAVFSASYLIGYLVLFAPGGVGFREYALVLFLVLLGAAGNGDAVILGATSRVWLTVLEVLPGVVGLLLLSPAQRAALRRTG
jgi:hypothetical protein